MKAKSLKELKPKFNSKFFFDTNVWLYLYFPQFSQVSQPIIDRYSQIYQEILDKECLVITEVIQMSEIINLTLQLEYKAYCKKKGYLSFKDFREKSEYMEALANAKNFTSSILKTTVIKGGIFSTDELKEMVQNCDRADFNDAYFARLCHKENAILITHDFDFNALDVVIELYTSNNKYL